MSKLNENGNVRAGEECPFFNECKLRTSNCPSKVNKNIRQHEFSCGAARFFVMLESLEGEERVEG